jgi:hypothetical protein
VCCQPATAPEREFLVAFLSSPSYTVCFTTSIRFFYSVNRRVVEFNICGDRVADILGRR